MKIQKAAQHIDARNADLNGSDFVDVSLSGTRFEDVNLQEAVFSDVNLSGVKITDANLADMTIDGVDVQMLFAAYRAMKENPADV